jgi:hypothetical protein
MDAAVVFSFSLVLVDDLADEISGWFWDFHKYQIARIGIGNNCISQYA